MEEMDYSLRFRWFVGLNADDEVWDATTFTKNRDRLLDAEVATEFLAQVVAQAKSKGLTTHEHFTVDGTLLGAWASAKSFQRKQGEPFYAGGDLPHSECNLGISAPMNLGNDELSKSLGINPDVELAGGRCSNFEMAIRPRNRLVQYPIRCPGIVTDELNRSISS